MRALNLTLLFLGLSITRCQQDHQGGGNAFPLKDPMLSQNTRDLIYGMDDRLDLFQVTNPFLKERALKTVALVKSQNLIPDGHGMFRLLSRQFGTAYNLCSSEPFRDQPTAAFCTGFLVAPDLLVTAGHCIRTAADCRDTRFVFGFSIPVHGQPRTHFTLQEVAHCSEIMESVLENTGRDFAVIRLDREITSVTPLSLRREGTPSVSDPLVVIGHPAGLPTKIAAGATVRSVNASFLVANLDTYGGNSGSPVFHAETGNVEGILVRGDTDFVMRGSCRVSNQCSISGCRGEDVTLIRHVLSHIPHTQSPPHPPSPPSTSAFFRSTPLRPIPDAHPEGVKDSLYVSTKPLGRSVIIYVNIKHAWRGDLAITLQAPDGQTVSLKAPDIRDAAKDVVLRLTVNSLSYVSLEGDWTLHVVDTLKRDTGTLLEWSLDFQSFTAR